MSTFVCVCFFFFFSPFSSSSFFQLSLAEEQSEVSRNGLESKELVYLVHIYCQVCMSLALFR